jgi:eukaryotic-like serine/threonine-protein kinase
MTLTTGELINGKYRILRLIGDGGMGSVYEARHEQLGVSVALKFLRADIAERPGLAARFLQEARVSATLNSPHVAHVTDVDTAANGSPYLVMELLSGESLQSLLNRRGQLSRDEALDFALQILVGLDTAHALGVVHRDLKPDNVFVTPSNGGPLLKLIDFGIAKLRESSEFKKELTSAGVVMGTPEYMAPEQLYAAHEVDVRADTYSLGVMLFEMLSGTRPADGDDVERIVGQVLTGEVKRLGTLMPELPQGLVAAIEKAMHPNRDERFASADEFRVALTPFTGALSRAGELARALPAGAGAAASPSRLIAAPSSIANPNPGLGAPGPQLPAPPASEKLPDTLDGPPVPASRVPKTLPPDDGPVARGTEIAAAAPHPPPPSALPMPPRLRPKRRSSGWLIGILGVGSLLLGAAIVVLLTAPQRVTLEIPALPPIEIGGAPATSVAPTQVPPSETKIPNSPQAPATNTQPRPQTQRPPDVALPFPSFTLPSALPPLPPLPSGLPTTFPSNLPQVIPSVLPPLPPLPFPFPGTPAPASSSGAH